MLSKLIKSALCLLTKRKKCHLDLGGFANKYNPIKLFWNQFCNQFLSSVNIWVFYGLAYSKYCKNYSIRYWLKMAWGFPINITQNCQSSKLSIFFRTFTPLSLVKGHHDLNGRRRPEVRTNGRQPEQGWSAVQVQEGEEEREADKGVNIIKHFSTSLALWGQCNKLFLSILYEFLS